MKKYTKVISKILEDSIVITLPSELSIEDGEEFYVFKDHLESLVLVPKVDDYFQTITESELVIDDESNTVPIKYQPMGSEWE
ncbi:hypothetical protein HZY88_03275 [Aerococcaceae bacterium DSM 111176]|nr:hypothetical protein [Aerococcaceae bacterium DSM 111176]